MKDSKHDRAMKKHEIEFEKEMRRQEKRNRP
jgi:hypothetical protein